MYIEPNTIIKLYNSVPLDNSYNHTLYFSGKSAQNNYFHATNLPKYTLDNNSYQRVHKGSMRIGVKSDSLYDCNYLAFQNTSFGNKWFYAFITSVEYVNNETSEVTFEVDVIQTYMFDVEIKQCYVEREHSATDKVGDNVLQEPVNIGDITCNAISSTRFFDSYVAVIGTAYNPDGQAGGTIGGLFSGIDYVAGSVDTPADVTELLNYLDSTVEANKSDSVVSLFIMPTAFYPTGSSPEVQVAVVEKNTSLHGYTPRNKKLLTFPYNYLSVDCGNNEAIYRYEWFGTETCNFSMIGTVSCNPQIMLVPDNYNGSNEHFNYVEKLVMSDFPQIAWSTDSFKMWLAQDATSTALQGIASLGAIAGGMATENPQAILGGVNSLTGVANNIINAYNRPPQAKGTNSGTIDVATRTKNFYFRQMQISKEYAKVIDNFFDVYGYAKQEVKKPAISNRPHWNFIKTRDCTATGSAPADDIKKVCEIYNNGITFWKHANEVGNYSLDNSPS